MPKRIAFDLDDTLIRGDFDFPLEEKKNKWFNFFIKTEPLRFGIVTIWNALKSQNIECWIYTSSLRSTFKIKMTFKAYGLKPDGIVNQMIHDRSVDLPASKYPPAFGIDVLIDNSKGVKIEGERNGFDVLVVDPEDEAWVEKILSYVAKEW